MLSCESFDSLLSSACHPARRTSPVRRSARLYLLLFASLRLVLHIGTHKTGTTTLQRGLDAARAQWLAHGVLVPRTDREPWPDLPKHCSVFSAAASGDAERAVAERATLLAEAEAAGAHTLVVSEEGLSEPNPLLPAFFAPLAGTCEIDVVCYLRRPDLFVESLYNQFVRETARREGRPILTFARAAGVRQRLDYAAMLARWRALPARVHALDFDREAAGPGLVASFSRAAGLPAFDAEPSNRSPDMRLALLLARLNRQRIDYDLGALLQAARALQQSGRFPPLRHLLGADERARLLDDLAPALERLAAETGVRFSDAPVAGEPAAATEDVDPAYATELLARLSLRG